MNCSFCHGHSRPHKQMTLDELETVLNKLKGLTEHIYFHLMGEPLTHPDISTFISKAKEHGFKPMITTHGTLLPQKGDDIINSGVYKVNISLHSFEKDDFSKLYSYLDGIIEFCEKASSSAAPTTPALSPAVPPPALPAPLPSVRLRSVTQASCGHPMRCTIPTVCSSRKIPPMR